MQNRLILYLFKSFMVGTVLTVQRYNILMPFVKSLSLFLDCQFSNVCCLSLFSGLFLYVCAYLN